MSLYKGSTSSHYYTSEGVQRYDADLRVARKELLFPSPTTIDKDQFTNPFLENWKKGEVILACVENPRMPHESEEQYGDRIEEISNRKASIAAEFGTMIHDACEDYPNPPLLAEARPFYDHFARWADENIRETIAVEAVLVDKDLGVAGKTDRIFVSKNQDLGRCCLDIKTQKIRADDKGRKKPTFYPSWARQLSFYAGADAKKSHYWPMLPTCINVVLDSTEPSAPYIKIWEQEEIVFAYHDFVCAVNGWNRKRDYWPVGQWTIQPSVPMPFI